MLPWLLCAVLSVLSFYLLLRIVLLHKSFDDLRTFFAQNVGDESNVLISLSSRDPYARICAAELNQNLRALRAQRYRYMSGDREIKNAIANISHDLRTPLTAICGYVQLLESEDLSPVAIHYTSIIRERAEAMRSLCEELFRYSLASSGEQPMNPEVLSLNAVLQESIAAAYTMLKEHGITPIISFPTIVVHRPLDHGSLLRVFSNLLSNAAKYSTGDLSISLSEKGDICFANAAPALCEIEVGRLFDRFYTVDSARKSTGLGLAIAKTLVERMGGSIDAIYSNNRLTITARFPKECH